MIKSKLKAIYNRIVLQYFSEAEPQLKGVLKTVGDIDSPAVFEAGYSVEFMDVKTSVAKHKWVGAQYLDRKIYGIPSDETRVLVVNGEIDYIDGLRDSHFKWTGGCVWNDAIFCFPRTANSFLKIEDGKEEEMPLSISYNKEHHYSGVCTDNGIVYQPPRNTNHILRTDLNTGKSTKINIVKDKFRINFRYCGSIIHPNGYIYFFPENGRVIKLDPNTDKWCFIGQKLSTMCFDAKIGVDGNIYGFSAYRQGIMKIDVQSDTVEMIHQEISPGAFGTKYGIDGWLYSLPGDGTKIWKYDVKEDFLEEVFDLHDETKAKYAGGTTLPDGTIVCIPATAKKVLLLRPNKEAKIPKSIYKKYYVDNY